MVLRDAGRKQMAPATSRLDRRSDGQGSSVNQFEFLTSSSEMCAADDVIFGGKLLPFVAPPPPQPRRPQTHIPSIPIRSDHRRSISLEDPHPKAKRNETHIYRSSSLGDPPRGGKITGDCRKLKNQCPLALGPARVPAAMEMKEIRSRQRRRRPTSPERKEAAGKNTGGERSPWKLLETLSCRAMDAVAIA